MAIGRRPWMNAHNMEKPMNEPLFGAPMWSNAAPLGVGWLGVSGPISLSRTANAGLAGFNAPPLPLTGPIGSCLLGMAPITNVSIPDPYALTPPAANLPQQTVFGGGYSSGLPAAPSPFVMPSSLPALAGPEFVAAYGIPALLAVVAARRGQPMGPTNAQECEDFIYDALEWLPGVNEVEVRCENGRVTLTGSVPHKRLKRDLGEIGWAILAIVDVQNNITIATKRRSRGASRDTESHSTAARKQS